MVKIDWTGPVAKEPVWRLEQALEVVRNLNAHLEPLGFHTGMTGGVLFRGESSKDLDLIVYCRGSGGDPRRSIPHLREFGLTFTRTPNWREYGDRPESGKDVEIWEMNGCRVDFFFLK